MTGRDIGGERGFTLIELVVSIVIAAIIVGVISMFMVTPIEVYFSQEHRSDLADSADSIVRWLDQDVSSAVPNSLRMTTNGNVIAVEMITTTDSARYWNSGETPSGPPRELDFTGADTAFATDGTFNAATYGLAATARRLIVNNQASPLPSVYDVNSTVLTRAGDSIGMTTVAGESDVTMTPGFKFAAPSPTSRVYVMGQTVDYLCDQKAGTLTRYAGYTIAANPAARDSAAKLNAARPQSVSLVGRFVTVCRFAWTAETAYHGGMLSLELTLANPGGTLPLFHQVGVQGIR